MELRLYTDDTTGYAVSNLPTTLEFYINGDLSRLSQWLDDIIKTLSLMLLSRRLWFLVNPFITMRSTNIQIRNELKLLGVTIDNKLTFSPHIKVVVSKVHGKIAALRKIRNFIDSQTALKLYKAYILPHFDYCSPLLIKINQTL